MVSDELLKQQVLEIVNNQIESNEPKETKETLVKLAEKGLTEEESMSLVGQCVAFELFEAMKTGKTYNNERFIKNLKSLY